MTGIHPASQRRRSQVVSLSYNRTSKGARGAAGAAVLTPVSSPVPFDRGQQPAPQPVLFTDNTVPAITHAPPVPSTPQKQKPHLVPLEKPVSTRRQAPLLVRINRGLQTTLLALCGVAICAYGFDVVVSSNVGKQQEQARRLSEQNSELSSELLKAISFGTLQESIVGRFGLRVPDEVRIVQELAPPAVHAFKERRHHLPLMSGY